MIGGNRGKDWIRDSGNSRPRPDHSCFGKGDIERPKVIQLSMYCTQPKRDLADHAQSLLVMRQMIVRQDSYAKEEEDLGCEGECESSSLLRTLPYV